MIQLIKEIVKKIVSYCVNYKVLYWFMNHIFVRTGNFMEGEYKLIRGSKYVPDYFPDLTVKHGPFSGLRYPKVQSVCSTLFPKLLGSYEKELEDIISDIIASNKYTEIVDIGCAEGYYAVGFLTVLKDIKMYAFDLDPKARILCKKMAVLNEVSDRIFIDSFCDSDVLFNLSFSKKSLIISDCQGFEKILFTDVLIQHLSNMDFLIELHDSQDIYTSIVLKERFKKTHDIQVISSIEDYKKAQIYDYPELDGLDLSMKKILIAEERPQIMEWIFCRSK